EPCGLRPQTGELGQVIRSQASHVNCDALCVHLLVRGKQAWNHREEIYRTASNSNYVKSVCHRGPQPKIGMFYSTRITEFLSKPMLFCRAIYERTMPVA